MKYTLGSKLYFKDPAYPRAYIKLITYDIVDAAYWISIHNHPTSPEGYRTYVYYPNLVRYFKIKIPMVLPLPG